MHYSVDARNKFDAKVLSQKVPFLGLCLCQGMHDGCFWASPVGAGRASWQLGWLAWCSTSTSSWCSTSWWWWCWWWWRLEPTSTSLGSGGVMVWCPFIFRQDDIYLNIFSLTVVQREYQAEDCDILTTFMGIKREPVQDMWSSHDIRYAQACRIYNMRCSLLRTCERLTRSLCAVGCKGLRKRPA